jgi:hypothetical protein
LAGKPKEERKEMSAYRIQYNDDQTLFSITTVDEERSTQPSELPEDGRAHLIFDGQELFVTLAGYEGPCSEDTVFELKACKTHVDTVEFDASELVAGASKSVTADEAEEDEDTPDADAVGSGERSEDEESDEEEGEEGEGEEDEEETEVKALSF